MILYVKFKIGRFPSLSCDSDSDENVSDISENTDLSDDD